MGETLDVAEHAIVPLILWLKLGVEVVGVFWIAVGAANGLILLFRDHAVRHAASFTASRLAFSRYLSLALEFQLAADLLSTSVSPTWQGIGKLGAIAVIRTLLNFFLSREIKAETAEREEEVARISEKAVAPAVHAAAS